MSPDFITHDPEFETVLGPEPRLSLVARTNAHEGPVYLPGEDALLFSALPNGSHLVPVKRLALDGRRFPLEAERISVLRSDTAAANGMTVDPQGRLVICEQGTHDRPAAITRDGETLASAWRDVPLNSPNDVVVKRDGTIWFTDPSYGHLQGFRPKPLLGDNVYRLEPDSGRIVAVAESFDKPNGICFSPDESLLYVTDNGSPHHLKAFDVVNDRRLANERVIAVSSPEHPDGLKTDAAGRVYVSAAGGVQVLTALGELIGEIGLPGAVNFCFGGAEGNVLFITADDAIWAAELAASGPPRPKGV